MQRPLLAGLAAALLLAPSAVARPHRHAVPAFEVVKRSVEVPPGKARVRTLRCPRDLRYFAASYAVGGQGTIQLLRAANAAAAFRVVNVFGAPAARANLAVRCVKPETKPAGSGDESHTHAIVQKFVSKRVVLPGQGRRKRATVGCGRGWTAINGFIDAPRSVVLENSTRDSTWRVWEFDVLNTSDTTSLATIRVQCLRDRTGDARGGSVKRHRHLLVTDIESYDFEVPASRTINLGWSCLNLLPISPTWQLAGGEMYLTAFRPRGERFRFTVLNRGPESNGDVAGICLDPRTSRAG